jgi:hypothetical protein
MQKVCLAFKNYTRVRIKSETYTRLSIKCLLCLNSNLTKILLSHRSRIQDGVQNGHRFYAKRIYMYIKLL